MQPFNVLRYEIGQRYASHYDAFDPAQYGPQKNQRVCCSYACVPPNLSIYRDVRIELLLFKEEMHYKVLATNSMSISPHEPYIWYNKRLSILVLSPVFLFAFDFDSHIHKHNGFSEMC